MKTVISASRRTDIPAFYLPWFIKKIEQGYINISNPFNRKQIKRVDLSPEEVGNIGIGCYLHGIRQSVLDTVVQ